MTEIHNMNFFPNCSTCYLSALTMAECRYLRVTEKNTETEKSMIMT